MNDKKYNIILDLDNTLISAEPTEEFPFDKPGIKEKSLKFRIFNMDNLYIVFERPYLQEFLDYLFSNFNVSIWTYSSRLYMTFILENIILRSDKPERRIDFVFFHYHCEISNKKKRGCPKDLTLLEKNFKIENYNLSNTFIIDDLKEVADRNMENCIHIKEFNILDEESDKDNELLKVKEILERLK